MTWGFGADQGQGEKEEQQDVCRIVPSLPDDSPIDSCVAVIADGMSAGSGGLRAAEIAVTSFLHTYLAKLLDEPMIPILLTSLQAAHHAVIDLARQLAIDEGCGSTLVAAVVDGWKLNWISVGDSRAYLLRSGRLFQLTTDSNQDLILGDQVAAGLIPREAALSDPHRKKLISALGYELRHIDRNVHEFTLCPGDRLLLCTDGVYSGVDDDTLATLCKEDDSATCCSRIIKVIEGLKYPRQDNFTIVVLTPSESDGALN